MWWRLQEPCPSRWHQCHVFLNPCAICGLVATIFNTRGCFNTRAMGSAGWDDSWIHYICSINFPTNILPISQEKGCVGRCPGANGSNYIYHCCTSLPWGLPTCIFFDFSAGERQAMRVPIQKMKKSLQSIHHFCCLATPSAVPPSLTGSWCVCLTSQLPAVYA